MILFPAIDLKGGQCVRLKLGEMASATVYNADPGAQAKTFEDQGFSWLHVVDLDGAFEGRSVNGAAVEGWAKASTLGAVELAKKFEGAGVAAIVYTDIDRDGVLAGINWEATIDLADAVSIPVIASGGLASIADIVRMTMPDARKLEGAISGRALYDGRIDPAEALAVLHGLNTPPSGFFEERP